MISILFLPLLFAIKHEQFSNGRLSDNAGMIFMGIALISVAFASLSFFLNIDWFISGKYKTQWNIGGVPATFYEPELVYGLLKSTFLASVSTFIERLLKHLSGKTSEQNVRNAEKKLER